MSSGDCGDGNGSIFKSIEFKAICSSAKEYGYVNAKNVVAFGFSAVRYLKLSVNVLSSVWKENSNMNFVRYIKNCIQKIKLFYNFQYVLNKVNSQNELDDLLFVPIVAFRAECGSQAPFLDCTFCLVY